MGKPKARERILQAAGRLFHKHGYANVGINEIIETADTAKASFYQHFPSKEALCEAWLAEVHEMSEEMRLDVLKQDEPPERKIANFFGELSKYLLNSDYRGCPYTNTCAMVDTESEGVIRQIEFHKISIRDFFEAILVERHRKSHQTEALANQLFVLYSGATTEAQNLRSLWPVEAARVAALALFEAFKTEEQAAR